MNEEVPNLMSSNQQLALELSGYKKHYETSMTVVKKLEEIQNENKNLRLDLEKTSQEKKDISSRLKMALEKIESLTSQLKSKDDKYTELCQTVQREKISHEQEVQSLKQRTYDEENKNRKLEQEILELKNAIRSLEDCEHNRQSSINTIQADSKELLKEKGILIDQLKGMKKIVKKERLERKQLDIANRELENRLQNQCQTSERVIAELESKIQAIEVEVSEKDKQREKMLRKKEKKIKELEAILEKTKADHQKEREAQLIQKVQSRHLPSEDDSELNTKIEQQELELKKACSALESWQRKSMDLATKLQGLQKGNESLTQDNQEMKAVIRKLQLENEQLQNKLVTITEEKALLEMQTEANTSTTNEDQAQETIDRLTVELNKVKSQVSEMNAVIEQQAEEVSHYSQHRNRLASMMFTYETIIQRYDDLLTQKNHIIEQTKTQIQQCEKKKEVIPIEIWTNCGSPPALSERIIKVLTCTTSLESRIKHVLMETNKYYEEKSEILKQKLDDSGKNAESFNQKLRAFVSVISEILGKESSSLDVDPQTWDGIVSAVRELQNTNYNLNQSLTQQQQLMEQLLSKLQCSNASQVLAAIDEIFVVISQLKQRLREKKSREKVLIRERMTIEQEAQESEQHLRITIEELEHKMKEIVKQKQDALDSLSASKKQSDALKIELHEIRQEHSKQKEELRDSFYKSLEKLANNCETEKEKLVHEIHTYKQEVARTKSALDEKDKELCRWKNVAKTLKEAKDIQDQEYQQLKTKVAENDREMSDSWQKQQMKHEETLSQMKSKYQSLTELLKQSKLELSKAEARLQTLGRSNAQLDFEKQDALRKIEDLERKMTQMQKINETKLESCELASKMKLQSTLVQEQTKTDEFRRQMCSEILKEFPYYVDYRTRLDQAVVKDVLHRVSVDLKRLSTQDSRLRSLIGVNESESLEDSVLTVLRCKL